MPPPPADAGYEVLASRAGGAAGLAWELTVRLPAGSPFFSGHFAGQPIFPGVAQLVLVSRALADQRGHEVVLQGVRGLKFRQPLGPGDTVVVRLSPAVEDGDACDTLTVGFTLDRGGETVSRGTVWT